ncbi:MAG TPA: ankyrin repeat domain-containing protein [Bryobacteraceae bacterium]|jgi:ankyrin repeat protein|nr:ankyrin repeat domain-containing protein [Bryobacteraceae bacterium]
MKTVLQRLVPFGLAVFLMGASGTRPALVDAAKNGDREAVRTLLQKKVDANATDADGSTALLWASYRDDAESADLLLRTGARVNVANDLGATPLWAACQNGSAAMVRRLLDAGADPNAPLLAGETPVMVAARSGYPEIVEQLLTHGGNPNVHAARGQTALMWAAAEKHADVVKVLLAHGADVKARSEVWSEVMAVPPHGILDYNKAIPHGNETPLLFAVSVGDLVSAKLLVAAGADVNATDAWGVSATVLAAHADFGELVAFLLDQGADPNLAEAGFTALHAAIMHRDEKMVAALLDHGANPNAPLRTWTPTRRSSHDFNFSPALVGATPFWLAARFTQPGVMRLLAKHGADPHFVLRSDYIAESRLQHRKEATTALMAAMGTGGGTPWVQTARGQREALTLETAKLAVELGVDVNAANTDGRTALDAAKTLGFQTVVQFLVDKGARSDKPVQVKASADE